MSRLPCERETQGPSRNAVIQSGADEPQTLGFAARAPRLNELKYFFIGALVLVAIVGVACGDSSPAPIPTAAQVPTLTPGPVTMVVAIPTQSPTPEIPVYERCRYDQSEIYVEI